MKLTKNQIAYRKRKLKEQLKEELGWCESCGANKDLTLSHLIPVSQNKGLELERNNVTLDCISCHQIWEHKEADWKKAYLRIKDFEGRIIVIYHLDQSYYNRMLIRMPEWLQVIVEDYNYYEL